MVILFDVIFIFEAVFLFKVVFIFEDVLIFEVECWGSSSYLGLSLYPSRNVFHQKQGEGGVLNIPLLLDKLIQCKIGFI